MSLKKLKKEDLEVLPSKEIAIMILKDLKRSATTAEIYKKIIELLELPESTFENKISEFYTQLATDKNFILLEDGKWDLSSNHKSNKEIDLDEEVDEEEDEIIDDIDDIIEEDSYDDTDESFIEDSTDDDLKDLVIVDEEELDN